MREHRYKREAHIAAFYLSKFNESALKELGCQTWKEVYTLIAHALGYKEASIKHYRDSFDPLLSNSRQGWYQNNTYKTIRDIFNEFGNYDFETLSDIVKNILEENWTSGIYDSNFIANLTFIKNQNLLRQEIKVEKEQKRRERTPGEEACVSKLLQQEGGKREVPIFDHKSASLVGLADLITNTEIIEVKNIKNWKHAVGQVFAYWYYLALANANKNLRPRIHLFGINGINDYRIQLCQSLMKKIFSPDIDSVRVTYVEDDLDDFEVDIFDI